jgi:hypothetical protein
MLNVNGSGYKLDTIIADGATVKGSLHTMTDHIHGNGHVIPSLAAPLTVVGTSTSWELGGKVLIGTSVLADPFDFHFINVESLDQNDTVQIRIYEGATDAATAIADVRVTRTANQTKSDALPVMTPVLSSAKKTCIAIANKATVAVTALISLNYHTY